ncbi:hypothetical protein EVAR_31877_1 [Eumeta japonica]|uniref:Uncharacterized protein n=1 Tax=Eumeta variegata TaxID=151549 RepID=A0A4C1WZ13_EUMVA|nr:hypothetical protein EVAR_31877_1 [Eumeta japonica]
MKESWYGIHQWLKSSIHYCTTALGLYCANAGPRYPVISFQGEGLEAFATQNGPVASIMVTVVLRGERPDLTRVKNSSTAYLPIRKRRDDHPRPSPLTPLRYRTCIINALY